MSKRYIKLEDLQKFPIRKDHYDKKNGDIRYVFGVEDMLEYAEYLPTADVVEVVRCRDCKYCIEHHYEEEGEKPYVKLSCKWSEYSHQPNDYCSYGERREENEG